MNNVIKAVFIEMLDNVGADYNDEMLSLLVEAYLKAGKDVGRMKFISQEILDKAKEQYIYDDFDEWYDFDQILIISQEECDKLEKIINVFSVYRDPLSDGLFVKFIVLERFFASLQYSVIKSI